MEAVPFMQWLWILLGVHFRTERVQAFAALPVLVSLSILLSACVGTIESTKVPKSVTVPVAVPSIAFKGIEDVEQSLIDKVEVTFFPATGDAEELVYLINYDGLSTPITVPALYLKPNYLGLLVYTVVGLDTNATYNFEVQVKNLKTAGYSQAALRNPPPPLPMSRRFLRHPERKNHAGSGRNYLGQS